MATAAASRPAPLGLHLAGALALALLVSSPVLGQTNGGGGAVPRQSDSGSTRSGGQPGALCTISRVVDGDTVRCLQGNERVRLLLVDAPEMAQGAMGAASRAALERLLPVGREARLVPDVQERDRYGRLLAYIYTADGRMVNEEMARQGYVVVAVYPPNVRHVERIRAAVDEARRANRGLWAEDAFECLPTDFRRGGCGAAGSVSR